MPEVAKPPSPVEVMTIPSPVTVTRSDLLIAQAENALAKRDRSRYWYRRVALAKNPLARVSDAVGLLAPANGEGRTTSVWLVAPGVAVAPSSAAAEGARVLFDAVHDCSVTRVRRAESEPDFVFLDLSGNPPAAAAISRSALATGDVAAIGRGPEWFIAVGRTVVEPKAQRLELGGALPTGATGMPVVSLAGAEVVGLALGGGRIVEAARILTAMKALGIPALERARSLLQGAEGDGLERRFTPADYDDCEGYDPDFIGKRIPLPKPTQDLANDVLEFEHHETKTPGTELKYTHFSVIMSRSRRMSMFTAVNISGSELKSLARGGDPWQLDPRIDADAQFDNDLYVNNDLDRGHMVRRLDPVWGDDAVIANQHTFHYTNSCPQHKDLNQKIWNDLEEYVYSNTGKHDLKVNVFTGPVFGPDDPLYREARIPLQFWKVVTMVRDDGKISATAYILSQADMVTGLEFMFGEFRTYQLPIVELEQLTRLDFGELRKFDPKQPSEEGLESLRGRYTPIAGPQDIEL